MKSHALRVPLWTDDIELSSAHAADSLLSASREAHHCQEESPKRLSYLNTALLEERAFLERLEADLSGDAVWKRLLEIATPRIVGLSMRRDTHADVQLVVRDEANAEEFARLIEQSGLSPAPAGSQLPAPFPELDDAVMRETRASPFVASLSLPPNKEPLLEWAEVSRVSLDANAPQDALQRFRSQPEEALRLLHNLGATEFRPLPGGNNAAVFSIGQGRVLKLGHSGSFPDLEKRTALSPPVILETEFPASGCVARVVPELNTRSIRADHVEQIRIQAERMGVLLTDLKKDNIGVGPNGALFWLDEDGALQGNAQSMTVTSPTTSRAERFASLLQPDPLIQGQPDMVEPKSSVPVERKPGRFVR